MKKLLLMLVFMSSLMFGSIANAQSHSWISTKYQSDWSSYSYYRAPVTDGYVDVRLLVDNASFTDASFSVKFDSDVVSSTGISVNEIATGLSLSSVNIENLDGSWKKATINLTGNITVGELQYESESIMVVRFLPVAEGVFPLTLWPDKRYPERYYSCSLDLKNNGVTVPHQRKEYNDGTTLFTFTDKLYANLLYNYDINFGTPIPGYLKVDYADGSSQEFHSSDPAKGITIDPANGAYYISALTDATLYTVVNENYSNDTMYSINGSMSYNHGSPLSMFMLESQGFHSREASSEDMVLTVSLPSIGKDFATSNYSATLAGNEGIYSKQYQFACVDDDTITVTIKGGLTPDYYNIYVYKNDKFQGRGWFNAVTYYPVTFTVKDQNLLPVQNAMVVIPMFSMYGPTSMELPTDGNGQAIVKMPSDQWGYLQNYRIMHNSYDVVSGSVTIYDQPVDVAITLLPISGTDMLDYKNMATWWQYEWCMHVNDCDGADMNFDGKVNIDDLAIMASRWLK